MTTPPGFAPPTRARETAPELPYGATITPGFDRRAPVDPNVFVNAYTRPLPSYHETFAGPGYESKAQPSSKLAVAALVCGILGIFTALPALGGIVFGHLGLMQTKQNSHSGRGLAIGGMVLGYVVVGIAALLIVAIWVGGA